MSLVPKDGGPPTEDLDAHARRTPRPSFMMNGRWQSVSTLLMMVGRPKSP
ncbi:MAG: hypothetical protein R3B49_08830 [Phycisphaerales bacterium]